MKILIVKLGAIGDVIHTLPALAQLRRALPEAHLAWAVERGGAAKLLEGSPHLDELIELDMRGWRKSLMNADTQVAIRRAMMHLRNAGFDVALDFQGLLKSATVARLARIPRRIGFARDALREPASAVLLTERVAVDDDNHIIKKNLALVAHLTGRATTGAYEFPIAITGEDESFAARQAARCAHRFALLNPGGGWPTKLWGTEGFAALADRLWETHAIKSFITYGPGEEPMAEAILTQTHTPSAEALATTLKQFFALARRAQLFVGGDTGPMHLAAAGGAPIVALFGPTSARRNGPFNPADVIVERDDLDCRTDCYRRACSHTSCMQIPVDEVWAAVERRLATAPTALSATSL